MDYYILLKIVPSYERNLTFYVYRSKNLEDINTITKIKKYSPVIVLDEETYDQECMENNMYIVRDFSLNNPDGVTYLGPEPSNIPTIEYETSLHSIRVNDYTNVTYLKMEPLPLEHDGIMYYYSVIGVDKQTQMITHLSQLKGVLFNANYLEGTRQVFYTEEFTSKDTDEWHELANITWEDEIIIGDNNNSILYSRFKKPCSSVVKMFTDEEVRVNTRNTILTNNMQLTFPNVWCGNNLHYNFRKLNSYKVRNVVDGKYGQFSVPTLQQLIQVTNEQLIIFRKETDNNTPIDYGDNNNLIFRIIRRHGKYYNNNYDKLEFNKYNIDANEQMAIFSETSVQEDITINFNVKSNSTYNYTFYLVDVYGTYSEPCVVMVNT